MESDANKWSTFIKVAPKSDALSDDRYFDNFIVAPQYGAPFENDVKKWSYFDDMAPKSGVPI